jgi:hypothetical protein
MKTTPGGLANGKIHPGILPQTAGPQGTTEDNLNAALPFAPGKAPRIFLCPAPPPSAWLGGGLISPRFRRKLRKDFSIQGLHAACYP